MPELPDIEVYRDAIARHARGQALRRARMLNPFVLRTAVPPIERLEGLHLVEVRRLGKRVVLGFEQQLFVVIHLMIAGRFRWAAPGAKLPGKLALAAFDFDTGSLVLTEAGTKRRASIHLVEGEAALAALDPGGIEPLRVDAKTFATALRAHNHTIKRALTDPRLISGIGNSYSDEILHRARLSPFRQTQQMDDEEFARLHAAVRDVLGAWTEQLRREVGEGFPDKVTAFRPDMAVHGRYGQPCPVCGAPVQRIVHADNEMNYCARCQTGDRILADRALSRLLHDSFPRHLDDLG